MKTILLAVISLCFLMLPKSGFGQPIERTKASQSAISYENGLYRLKFVENDSKLFVKSLFFRRDLPHWRKGICRMDIGAVWYNGGWYMEDHLLFGRHQKAVDIFTGLSLRSGNLPELFLSGDLVFLNPELLLVVRPRPIFKKVSVEARLNMAFLWDYDKANGDYIEYVRVPGVGLSVGYILKKQPH